MVGSGQGMGVQLSSNAHKLVCTSESLSITTQPGCVSGSVQEGTHFKLCNFTHLGLKLISLFFCPYIKKIVPNLYTSYHWVLI